MKIAKAKNGFIIGTIFTVSSLLLTATFIVPMVSVILGMLLESLAASCVNNDPYSNVGKTTILLLVVIFIVTLILCVLSIKNKTNKGQEISNGRMVAMLSILYFIVHSLGFYIYWGVALGFRSDGQLIFSTLISHPISSFAFIFIGLLFDFAKKRNEPIN